MSDNNKPSAEDLDLEDLFFTFQDQYHVDKNPLCAWIVFAMCRRGNLSIPDFVLDYLDRASTNLCELAIEYHESKKSFGNIHSRISEALEMKKPGRSGRGNVFDSFNDWDQAIIGFTAACKINNGVKKYIAVAEVAEEFGVSEATVWRALPGGTKTHEAMRARLNIGPDEEASS